MRADLEDDISGWLCDTYGDGDNDDKFLPPTRDFLRYMKARGWKVVRDD